MKRQLYVGIALVLGGILWAIKVNADLMETKEALNKANYELFKTHLNEMLERD